MAIGYFDDEFILLFLLKNVVDESGATQGDRLLAIKAKRQHEIPLHVTTTNWSQGGTKAKFTSPTTPVKPVGPPTHRQTHLLLNGARRLHYGEQMLPSKVS